MVHKNIRVTIHVFVLAFFTILTIIYFIPFNPLHKISGYIFFGDAIQRAWAPAWFCHAITKGLPLFDANILAPLPHSLAYSEGDFEVGVQSIILWLFSHNAVLNFNLLNYVSFILAAFGMFLLILEIYPNALWGALFAGIVFSFNAFRAWRIPGHLTILQIHWLPFAVLFLIKFLREQKIKHIIPFGFFSLLLFLSNFYLMVIAGSFYVAFVVLLFLLRRFEFSPKHLLIVIALIIDFLLVLPFIMPYTRIQSERFNILDDTLNHSANVKGYLFPPTPTNNLTSLSGLILTQIGVGESRLGENIMFFGFIPMILVVLRMSTFVKKLIKGVRLEEQEKTEVSLLIIATIFALFSFGIYLSWNSYSLPIKMPFYYAYKFIPPIRFMRAPARFGIVTIFSLSLISGAGLHFFLTRIKRPHLKLSIFLLVFLYTFAVDFYLLKPLPTFPVSDNAVFEYLREEKDKGRHYNILVLPTVPTPNRHAMLFSTFHWHSVMTGNYFPGAYLQDLESFMDWKPSVVLLLHKYKVDCIMTETVELAQRLGRAEFLRLVTRDGRKALFQIEQDTFNDIWETQRQIRVSRYKPVDTPALTLLTKVQIEKIFIQDQRNFTPMKDQGWFKLNDSKGSVSVTLPTVDPFQYNVVEITLAAKSSTDNATRGELYWETEDEHFMDEKKNHSFRVIMDGRKRNYRLDLSNNYQWLQYGKITRLRIDFLRGRTNAFEIFDISLSGAIPGR